MKNEDTIFLRALDLPHAARAAFLDEACGEDAALRARVERLLAAREATQPDRWNTFDTRARIGATFSAHAQLAAAEPWLISRYEGMVARGDPDDRIRPERVDQVLDWLIELYTRWEKPTEAARWTDLREARRPEPTPN